MIQLGYPYWDDPEIDASSDQWGWVHAWVVWNADELVALHQVPWISRLGKRESRPGIDEDVVLVFPWSPWFLLGWRIDPRAS